MSKTISVKFKDDIYTKAEKFRPKAKLNRNAFINEAVRRFTIELARKDLAEQFKMESELVRKHNMEVLSEFETLEDKIFE